MSKELIIDLNHPVWKAPMCTGDLSTPDGRYCPLGKLEVALSLKKGYADLREILEDDMEKIWRINDGCPGDKMDNLQEYLWAADRDEKRRHQNAINYMISILKKNPKVKLITQNQKVMVRCNSKSNKGANLMMGTVLKTERENQGLSLTQLSKRTGVPVSTLSDLENGTHKPRFENVAKVVRVLSQNR